MWDKHEKLVLELLSKNILPAEVVELLENHREKLANLQHERLIHLIVTMTVSICTVIFTSVTIFVPQPAFLIVDLMLAILLVAYLGYYRKLENTTQKWYGLTDRIKSKITSGSL